MPTLHLWRAFLCVSSVILLINMGLIDWIWLKDRSRLDETVVRVNQLTTVLASLTNPAVDQTQDMIINDVIGDRACGTVCQQVIERKVAEALGGITVTPANFQPTRSPVPTIHTTATTKSGSYYIPLSGTGSTSNRDWTDIPTTEIVIDWSEYGSDYSVIWDAYAKVHQGNGRTSLRLYDKTNGVAVPNSELETNSENSVHLVSGEMPVWSGKNTYIIQIKSLTGYIAYFESGRIKVVVK